MPETIAAPAPAAASTPAPAAPAPTYAPAAAPVSAPVSTPVAAPQQTWGSGGVTTTVDPSKFPIKEDYAREVLKEKLAAIPATEEAPVAEEAVAVEEPAAVEEVVAPEVPAPDAEVKPEEPVAEAEPEFDFDPPAIVTPEALSQMVTDNPEFGKLLEADPKLKGQLYKTAREAAELKPYREIFPDLESAKSAVLQATTWNDVKNVFMGSTTKEGTIATLGKIAELSYERDEAGNVVMENGNPVIGADFYAFVDHTVAIDLEHRKEEVQARLEANQYHVGAKTQEEAQAAYDRDMSRMAFFDDLMGQVVDTPAEVEQLPPHLREKAAEIERREKALNEKQHGEKVADRQKFETEMQGEADKRLMGQINKIISDAEKNGTVIGPYLKNILPKAIAGKVITQIRANPGLQSQMSDLQRLPIGSAARERRLAAIDRAYQLYLPDTAPAELREAGITVLSGAKAKSAKVDAQAQTTKQTEVKGSRGVSAGGAALMPAAQAFNAAQQEWVKANPGKPFDKVAREMVLPRVLQLMGTSSR